RRPRATAIAPAASPPTAGPPKFRRKLAAEVLRQASNGPTPVKKSKKSPIGRLTLLKKGAPTLILFFVIHSDRTGNIVPESTATHATSRIRLLKRKLDSREASESS